MKTQAKRPDLEEIEALLAKTTQSGWIANDWTAKDVWCAKTRQVWKGYQAMPCPEIIPDGQFDEEVQEECDANATFATRAHDRYVPELIAYVRELEGRLSETNTVEASQ